MVPSPTSPLPHDGFAMWDNPYEIVTLSRSTLLDAISSISPDANEPEAEEFAWRVGSPTAKRLRDAVEADESFLDECLELSLRELLPHRLLCLARAAALSHQDHERLRAREASHTRGDGAGGTSSALFSSSIDGLVGSGEETSHSHLPSEETFRVSASTELDALERGQVARRSL